MALSVRTIAWASAGKPALIVAVAATLVTLYGVDRFLAALERQELARQAREHYRLGEAQLAAGKPADALGDLRRAHILVRTNHTYQLSLARALAASGRLAEARTNLRALLGVDSNDGATNLEMARLDAREGATTEAAAYYHRALYGTWPGGSDGWAVRMELARFLAANGMRTELLSEMLLLGSRAGSTLSDGLEMAGLWLAAGAPDRSAEACRSLLRSSPESVEAYTRLGEAELAQSRFHAAQNAFLQALKRRPGDRELIRRLHFTTTLSLLDPTPRRLSSREKLERSMAIVGMAEEDLAACTKGRPVASDIPALLASADRARNRPPQGPATNEVAESRLALAERLWEARVAVCGRPSSNGDPLPLLMHVLSQ